MTINLFLAKFPVPVQQVSGARRIVFASVLSAAFLSGCAVQEAPKIPVAAVPAAPEPKPTALTDEADTALKAAEQSVTEARIKRALWTAAVEELERARSAAKGFDSVATLRHAREAITLCGLSIAQLSAAPVTW